MKQRTLTILLFLFLFIAVGMFGNLYFVEQGLHLTEENTLAYTATVTEIATRSTADDMCIEIVTEEYGSALILALSASEQNGQDFLADISVGDVIIFRIQKELKESLESKHLAIAVSLSTAQREYYSLEMYNAEMQKNAVPVKITGVVLGGIALIGAACCILRLTGVWRSKPPKSHVK